MKTNPSPKEQTVKYSRAAIRLLRIARNSPGNPEALVRSVLAMADKLTHVSRSHADDQEAMIMWRCGAEIERMVHSTFGYHI